MKKFIVIALACILTVSSFLFTACDKRVDNNTPSEQTTDAETDAPEKPLPIPSANGKNGKQLFEDAMTDYANSKSLDLSMTVETSEEGVKTTEKIELRVNETSMYMNMDLDETAMKIWFVDNVVYVDTGDGKFKASNTSINDVLGEGFLEELMSELPTDISDIPNAYMDKMANAQIYSYKGIYYFSVTLTDAEAIEMGVGETGYTETLLFDSAGAIKKIIYESPKETMTLLINSYGKDVEISAPENADEFIEETVEEEAGAGDQDPVTYAVYEQIMGAIADADVYTMNIDIDERPYMQYENDGNGGIYLGIFENDLLAYEIWSINGQGYIYDENMQRPETSNVTNEMLAYFQEAETLRSLLAFDLIHGNEMKDLSIVNGSSNQKILSFEVNYSEGISDFYTFTFDSQLLDIHVKISSTLNGQLDSTIEYYFGIIDDPNFKVIAPI